ncbi:hypothetical protein PTTG_08525 [Puccinia triticina 1-1 BBBD Race 1]|uniref:Sas10 domain-containing protein n=1 Tax=Puccinia triticina (isolate 1-1 / race 1 (BBBD)) TaxID=630390 RepID=A0A180H280_PUCT1|nr:hypothetical protein PTTG_08525 [Puccinia triticina 1-1 BBBD Race 1]WAR60548.1 hypothetical protein PtB15_9B487 [Puccinia triticina]
MARGKPQRPGKRPSRSKPQNVRPDVAKFDPRQSSIKRLADWDQEEAQDEQDDFFEGLDKVSLQQTSRDTRFENDLEDPEQLLDIDDGEEDDEQYVDDQSESESEKSKPRKQRKPKVSVDNSHKGRFAKGTSALETHSDSINSEEGSDDDEDQLQLDQNDLELEGDGKMDENDGSSEEDESTWKSYHVTKSKSKKKKTTNDPEAVAQEEERRALELEEVKRLQVKARSKLTSSDFSSYLDYASDEEILATKATEKLNQDRISSSHSTLVKEFDSEPAAVAYLLKTKPECLALLTDFRRSLGALSELQDKVSSPSEPIDGDPDKNEFNRAIDLLHYHVLSTYVSTTAFYMHLSLHIPPPAPALLGSVTKSLIDLRNTLNLMEQVGLIGDGSGDELGGSGTFDGEFPASEFDQELRDLLFDQSDLDEHIEPSSKRRKSSGQGSAKSQPDEDKGSAQTQSQKTKKKKKKVSKKVSHIEVEDPNELLKNLPPRPSKSILNSSELNDRIDVDFLESTSLSEKEATEKEKKKKSLRFYTAKIDAKGKRREKALAGTGIVSGDSDLPYITKESQRREFLKKQDHSMPDIDDDVGQFDDSLDGYQPDVSFDQDGQSDYYSTIKELKLSAKKTKKMQHDGKRMADRNALMTEAEGGAASGPREISRQILKNKGLTPKRAKENRNPRVKKRKRFQKAEQKISSQRPTFKPDQAAQSRTLNGYQGEKSGVKVGVVKSRKL